MIAFPCRIFWSQCLFGALYVGFVKGKTCWDTTWYNSSSPAVHAGSEFEAVNNTVLNTICPDGGPVVAAHCKDERGEPFTGFKNDTGSHYLATCNVVNGLQCHPYNGTVGASCADFAIQYGCNCPTTTKTTTSTTPALTITTTTPISTSGANITAFPTGRALVRSSKVTPAPTTTPFKSALTPRTTTIFATGRALLLSMTTKTATKTTSETSSTTRTATMAPTAAASLLSSTAYSSSSTRVANSKAENNSVSEKWKITDTECPRAKLQIGTWCVTWWIPILVVSGSLFAISIVVSVCLYKASIAQRTRNSQIYPLS